MSHKLDSDKPAEKDVDPSRRVFLKFLAASAVVGTANGMVPSQKEKPHRTHAAVAHAQAELGRLAPELAEYDPIDILGFGLFGYGVQSLARGSNITKGQYIALGALLAAKYSKADATGKAHLIAEGKSNCKTLGVIIGTIAIGDGLKMDLTRSCEVLMGKAPDQSSEVALLNMFSSFVSPVVTTVGNASVISSTANRLADGDKDFMSVSIGHSSGRSGYLLFGDPPFLAMIDKYGFKEAVSWQLTRMLPLALYSLVSSTMKMNVILAKRAGDPTPYQTAWAQTKRGIKDNIPYLAKIIGSSLTNAAKYFSGADLSQKVTQSSVGLEIEVGSAISTKLANLFKLPWDKSLDKASADDFEGLVTDKDDQSWKAVVENIAPQLSIEAAHKSGDRDEKQRNSDVFEDEFVAALLARDFSLAKVILIRNGFSEEEAADHIDNLKSSLPADYVDEATNTTQVSMWRKLLQTIISAPGKTVDMHRIKTAFGHNVGDVLNVFPFQANCVPFLLPLLHKFVHKMESMGLSSTQKEIAIFMIVMAFSMVADNYVAVKMGLDLLPNKPQIPLIAGIEGGELTSIGNMANMAQFNSDSFSLKDSLARIHLSIDNVTLGMVYALALGDASIRPTDADLVAAKHTTKQFMAQILGNPALQTIVESFSMAA